MKCAILGNGPSRSAYSPDKEYDYRIGCNIPWAVTDCTIIIDPDVVTAWSFKLDIIKCPVWLSRVAYRHSDKVRIQPTKVTMRDYVEDNKLFLGIEPQPEHYSSGHIATNKAIELGYKYIDLYGFDSYFEDTMDSYTRLHVKDKPMNHIKKWRGLWDKIIASHPDIKFNFIRT
jgi:hypothetical protein